MFVLRQFQSKWVRVISILAVTGLLSAFLLFSQELLDGRRSLQVLVRSEVAELGVLSREMEFPALSPWRKAGPAVDQFLIRSFLDGKSIGRISQELRRFAGSWDRSETKGIPMDQWLRDLEELSEEEHLLDRTEWLFSQETSLSLARLHVSQGQGAISAGLFESGLVHLLAALRFSQRAFGWDEQLGRDREVAFIAGTVLYFVFDRPSVLRKLQSLDGASIWSVRADRLLNQERRL